MKEKLGEYYNWVMGKGSTSNNDDILTQKKGSNSSNNFSIRMQQFKNLIAIILVIFFIAGFGRLFIKNKTDQNKSNSQEEKSTLTVELADKNLDPEKHWRNYFEEKQDNLEKALIGRIEELSKMQEEKLQKVKEGAEQELLDTKAKLKMAQEELSSASLDMKRLSREQMKVQQNNIYQSLELEEIAYNSDIELDVPKSAKNYMPEGTYFTGHLLGGIAVSTGLNTPDENATPVAIKLIGRFERGRKETTNLSPLNNLKLENCRIMGSSYGALSSERAIIRLEKLICEQDGTYITSKVAGQIFGSDGLNGIKGTVIATNAKHIKNAAIGGLISGISSSAKGQDGSSMSASGIISTKSKGAKNLLSDGALTGASNAGDKVADYYLRQAESLSPILTVPSGVRVNAEITKGFLLAR